MWKHGSMCNIILFFNDLFIFINLILKCYQFSFYLGCHDQVSIAKRLLARRLIIDILYFIF